MYSSSLAQVSPASRMEGNELRQNRALAGAHMPWKWRFLNGLLTRGSGSSVRALNFFRYLQDFLKWRDPDSNRGHHDFQSYSEALRYAVNPYR